MIPYMCFLRSKYVYKVLKCYNNSIELGGEEMSVIELNYLTKLYSNNHGVKNVFLNVEKGEIYGLIGPNGAGKSTIIRTMLNLLHPSSGTVMINGLDSVSNYTKILASVGYLPGELHYYDNMRAINILKYSEKFYGKDCSVRRNELASLLDFDLHMSVNKLSLGNKKKLGIIDAMQHEPEILILDEPTSGLDPLMQRKFFDLLKDFKNNGNTVLFSSHVLSEVQKVCDRVAIIKDGEVVKVEDMSIINNQKVKQVKIKTLGQLNSELEGLSGFKVNEDGYEFLYKGEINKLMSYLNGYEVLDLEINEPNLEDVFIHFYE
jgi:ABC-2 type transport system ATP-binding protein